MIELRLPWPPSNNRMHRRVLVHGRPVTLLSKAGRQYYHAVADAVIEQLTGKPIPNLHAGRLCVSLDVWPPDRRRRDLDNVFKAVLDGCTKAGIWADDEQIDELTIRRGAVTKGGAVMLRAGCL